MAGRIETRSLDDQGNLIVGIHRLRKTLREEKIDAVIGPAMSDVSAAAAVDLSARKSRIAMVTPTATTHGIAALGDGIFQLNVTTGTLGQRIASYATGCLKLKDFAIVAPESEYGYQLAEAFQKTVERKGGTVVAVQYFHPEAQDLAPQFEEIRKVVGKMYIDKLKAEGATAAELDWKAQQKIMSDSTLPLDGIFLAATNGEEAFKLAGQASFNKLRAQFLGSSGWNDKSILHRTGNNAIQGAYFSVDFQENPKTEAYQAFSRAYNAKWKRQPDKVAALAYDAARFLLQGMAAASNEDQLIASLKSIRSFNGVLGRIAFDEKYGANANAALYRVEKKGFKEVETCPEAE
jgi:ABC-type branched-subunit amino acid transport system substrate-binding protein